VITLINLDLIKSAFLHCKIEVIKDFFQSEEFAETFIKEYSEVFKDREVKEIQVISALGTELLIFIRFTDDKKFIKLFFVENDLLKENDSTIFSETEELLKKEYENEEFSSADAYRILEKFIPEFKIRKE